MITYSESYRGWLIEQWADPGPPPSAYFKATKAGAPTIIDNTLFQVKMRIDLWEASRPEFGEAHVAYVETYMGWEIYHVTELEHSKWELPWQLQAMGLTSGECYVGLMVETPLAERGYSMAEIKLHGGDWGKKLHDAAHVLYAKTKDELKMAIESYGQTARAMQDAGVYLHKNWLMLLFGAGYVSLLGLGMYQSYDW